jgi:hypothetical protein
VIILVADKKVKALKYRVNAGTEKCAAHSGVPVAKQPKSYLPPSTLSSQR